MKIRDKRPHLFEKSECNIWTDAHIQQKLLGEHLNPHSDGASRTPGSIEKITGFIIENIKPASCLLDLGCGPGLYSSFFSEKGYNVTGVDFNRASIEYAAVRNKEVRYFLGDYTSDYPQGIYDAVIMIYCDMGTHSDHQRDILLRNVYGSLSEGGVFIFDVFTEELAKEKTEGKNWEYAASGGFWNENEYLLLSQTFHFPENRSFAYQYNLLTRNENKHFILWDRYYSPEEIAEVVKAAGFKEVDIHRGILEGNNFTSSSEMFIVAKK